MHTQQLPIGYQMEKKNNTMWGCSLCSSKGRHASKGNSEIKQHSTATATLSRPLCVTFTSLGIATTSMVNKRGHEASSEHICKGKQIKTNAHTHTHGSIGGWLVAMPSLARCHTNDLWVMGSIYLLTNRIICKVRKKTAPEPWVLVIQGGAQKPKNHQFWW
jgi:hypothetical protein